MNMSIYDQVKFAADRMDDINWLAEAHNGDQDAAATALEREYFASLCGWVPLLTIIAVYRMFPEESQWAEYHYDLKAMVLLYDEQRNRERKEASHSNSRPKRVSYKKKYEQLQEEVERLTSENRKLRKEIDRIEHQP